MLTYKYKQNHYELSKYLYGGYVKKKSNAVGGYRLVQKCNYVLYGIIIIAIIGMSIINSASFFVTFVGLTMPLVAGMATVSILRLIFKHDKITFLDGFLFLLGIIIINFSYLISQLIRDIFK